MDCTGRESPDDQESENEMTNATAGDALVDFQTYWAELDLPAAVREVLSAAPMVQTPESVERVGDGPKLSGLLIAGFFTFFVLEKLLCVWCDGAGHHHGDLDLQPGAHSEEKKSWAGNSPMVTNLLFGAGIHSFVDGMAIATGYTVGTHLGVLTTVAIVFHEVPHHIGDVSILIHKGVPILRAVILSLLAGSTSVVGALLVLLVGGHSTAVTAVLLPFATANFLYIAAANLLPELRNEKRLRPSFVQIFLFGAGCSLMFALGS